MLRSYRERETMKWIDAEIRRRKKDQDESSRRGKDSPKSDIPRVELGSRRHHQEKQDLSLQLGEQSGHSSYQFQQTLQIFVRENILGQVSRQLPSSSKLPSLQGTYVIPCGLLRIAYVSLLDSRDGLDLARTASNWRKSGPRHDCIIVQDSEEGGIWFARLLHILVLQYNGVPYHIAYIRRFYTRPGRSPATGYVELEDRDEHAFIFVDSIVRSCIILSPNVHSNRLVVADLNDSDMFFRLLELS
ncbi:hypothetical protein FRC09_005625 [Ceratobasidium sp. 395]|nr:hypothetical protein FRC09_005625 [Ceratobasidium sp. 395]